MNTGGGWATWNTNGDFAKFYIQDSVANGMIPVFTYYQMLQSLPGGGGEPDAIFANLNNTATMTAYYDDLTLFFQKAGAFPGSASCCTSSRTSGATCSSDQRRRAAPWRRRCRKPGSPRCRGCRATSPASRRRS